MEQFGDKSIKGEHHSGQFVCFLTLTDNEMRRLKAIAIAFLNTLQLYYTKQECIQVEWLPPALYCTGSLPDRDPPGQRPPSRQRPP